MTIDGYEAYVGYDLGSLNLLLTYSDADSELDAFADYASLDGSRIDRQQGDTLSLSVDYGIEALNLTMHYDIQNVDAVPSRQDLDGATVDRAKDGFTVHNVSVSWSPASLDGLTVIAGIPDIDDLAVGCGADYRTTD